MTIGIVVRGARTEINVTNSDDLKTAWSSARGGEVITLTETVAAFDWTMNQSKPRNGVCVVLPERQPLKLRATAQELNTEIIGGDYSSFKVNGVFNGTGSTVRSIDLEGCSKLAIRGAYLGQGNNSVVGVNSTDIVIDQCINEWASGDTSQFSNCQRVWLNDWYGRNGNARSFKLRAYGDGTAPIDNAQSGTISGSIWVDSSHNDVVQFRNGCQHFRISNFDQHFLGQGIVSFHLDNVDTPNSYYLVENSTILGADTALFVVYGDHGTIRDCIAGPHPDENGPGNKALVIDRHPNELPVAGQQANRLQGGRCSVIGGAPIITPANEFRPAVDPGLSVINGDPGTELPVIPALYRLPWAPAYSRPTFTPWTGLAELVSPQIVISGLGTTFNISPTSTPVGRFLTMGLGIIRVTPTAREFRWLRNGEVVAGTHGNRVLATAGMTAGDVIVGQQRTTNAAGTTDWYSAIAVTLT